MPKALVVGDDGRPWVARSVDVLRDGGCDPVVVVLGARAEEARPLVPAGAEVVVSDEWSEGMGTSLRTGLAAVAATAATAVVVHLVDLPDVGAAVVGRLLEATTGDGEPADVLARSAYDGVPGHPVLIGRTHWDGLQRNASGDRGARDLFSAHPHRLVECGDLATGRDVDSPPPAGA